MLDMSTVSTSEARKRYPAHSDASTGLVSAGSARALAAASAHVLRLRSAVNEAQVSTDRRLAGKLWHPMTVRSSLCADEEAGAVAPPSKLAIVAQEELTRFDSIVGYAGYELRLRNDNGAALYGPGRLGVADNVLGSLSGSGCESSVSVAKRADRPAAGASQRRAVEGNQGVNDHGRFKDTIYASAAILDPDGKVAGSLELLSLEPKQPAPADGMTRAIVHAAARAIEERLFRERYRREWVVMVIPDESPSSVTLFAVDRHQHIVGADRHGRVTLSTSGIAPENLAGGRRISVWELFEKDLALFRSRDRSGDVATPLISARTAETWSALVTPPQAAPNHWQDLEANVHTRPRMGGVAVIRQLSSAPKARGGLPPGVMRRVREYIDANLEANVGLDRLSEIAGLSRCHFARAFKQSAGATPHNFLIHRRLCKARDLLRDTNLPLAEIAVAAGFSDQSHFSRRFRQYVGVSPNAFRRSQR